MRLRAEQLPAALENTLLPVYFISGDEPLQSGEAADAVRQAAGKAGYLHREVFSANDGFSWNDLRTSAASLSIFADRKLIDLRMPSGKPGKEGANALFDYCQRLPADTLLLITAGKVTSAAMKSRWLQALDKKGVVVQVWPLAGGELSSWLQRRLQRRGMQVDREGLRLLASRVEGNLLAAAQEIEKLYILYGAAKLGGQQILAAVSDSSRYDVFQLVDSVLAVQPERIVKVLSGLRAEGIAAPVVLWALAREARTLLAMQTALQKGTGRDQVLRSNQIWDKRKQLVGAALQRLSVRDLQHVLLLAGKVDRQIKGEQSGDCWETLLALCLLFASVEVMAETG